MTAVDAADLVERYTSLALSLARPWGLAYPWLRDDFISEAGFALWRAALASDQARGSFATFARQYIRFALLRRFRDERHRNREAFRRVGDVVDGDEGKVAAVELLADDGTPPDAVLELVEDAERVRAALAGLPPDRRAAIELHIVEGVTLAQIGDARGTSGNNIGQQVRRDLDRIRERLGGD